MTSAAAPRFELDDFAAPAAAPTRDADEAFTRDDMERARREGVEAGRREAQTAIAEQQRDAIVAIANTLLEDKHRFERVIDVERVALREAAEDFIVRFASALASAREIESAIALVRRLLDASPDREPAMLAVSQDCFDQFHAALTDALARLCAADFVELVADPSLAAGDCRVSWRGGAVERRLERALAQLGAMFPQSRTGDLERQVKQEKRS